MLQIFILRVPLKCQDFVIKWISLCLGLHPQHCINIIAVADPGFSGGPKRLCARTHIMNATSPKCLTAGVKGSALEALGV